MVYKVFLCYSYYMEHMNHAAQHSLHYTLSKNIFIHSTDYGLKKPHICNIIDGFIYIGEVGSSFPALGKL